MMTVSVAVAFPFDLLDFGEGEYTTMMDADAEEEQEKRSKKKEKKEGNKEFEELEKEYLFSVMAEQLLEMKVTVGGFHTSLYWEAPPIPVISPPPKHLS